jgi:phage portal protein BeeE
VANLFRSMLRADSALRADPALSLNEWATWFGFNGLDYMVQHGGTQGQPGEKIEGNFQGHVQGAYKTNGVVFACIAARQLLFSEARFQFRRMRAGRPGELFGQQNLQILERPWENATTGDLLTRAILDVDLAGNFYGVRRGRMIRRLRPDWVTIIAGSQTSSPLDTTLVGYTYQEGGPASGNDPIVLLPEEVCHFAPLPDPLARHRGMSWLSPIVGEVLGDKAATAHKTNFFDAGAKLGYVVTMDPTGEMSEEQFKRWVDVFQAKHEGAANAYKTLFLSRGADVKVVGADLKQVDFKQVQGAGETRICAAARVPPIIVGVSEGLESATYSNYGQARRAFADLTMRPLWRNIAGALSSIIDVPAGAELWYDDRDIPFLQEDMKDEAEIQQMQAAAIRQLVDAGYTAESVVGAVTAGDLTLLQHSGLFSVQLQPPGASQSSASPVLDGQNGRRLLEEFVTAP